MKRQWVLWGGLAAGGVALWRLRRGANNRQPIPLRGKVVLITGASAGIGRLTAHAFAQEGAHLVLAARRAPLLEALAGELNTNGVRALPVTCDVTEEDDRQALIDAALREFGRIDVLVNNAGTSFFGEFHKQDPDDVQRLLQLNYYAPVRLCQMVAPVMLEQGEGTIVNVSSGAAKLPSPRATTYSSTKAALVAFTDALRRELIPHAGIHVASVMPSLTYTDLVAEIDHDAARSVGYHIDEPDVPAQAIVDAVRYRQREILLGGPVEKLSAWLQSYAPGLLDLMMKYFITPETIARIIPE